VFTELLPGNALIKSVIIYSHICAYINITVFRDVMQCNLIIRLHVSREHAASIFSVEVLCGCWFDSCSSEPGHVSGFCEHDNETSDSIKGGVFIEKPRDYKILKSCSMKLVNIIHDADMRCAQQHKKDTRIKFYQSKIRFRIK
jgi:hypothetical protein